MTRIEKDLALMLLLFDMTYRLGHRLRAGGVIGVLPVMTVAGIEVLRGRNC